MTTPMPIAAALAVTSCTAAPHRDTPQGRVVPHSEHWVRTRIAEFEAGSASGKQVQLLKLEYKGKPAYYLPSPCCDQFNYLYDTGGAILCAPSGGFAGTGDGQCPEVMSQMAAAYMDATRKLKRP